MLPVKSSTAESFKTVLQLLYTETDAAEWLFS